MGRTVLSAILLVGLGAVPLGAQSRVPNFDPLFNRSGLSYNSDFFDSSGFLFNQAFSRDPSLFRRRLSFPEAVIVPVPLYVGSPYPSGPSYPVVVQTAPQPSEVAGHRDIDTQIDRLREEVQKLKEDRLKDEIDRLKEAQLRLELRERRQNRVPREDEEELQPRASRRAEPRPPEASAQKAVVLVFRDGHRLQVQNYAVVGGTLWDFTEERARKILLSSLDLDATAKVNDERGLEFRLP